MLSGTEKERLRARLAERSAASGNAAHRLSPEEREALVREFMDGKMSIKQIAAKYGIARQSARYLIRTRAGVDG